MAEDYQNAAVLKINVIQLVDDLGFAELTARLWLFDQGLPAGGVRRIFDFIGLVFTPGECYRVFS